MAQFHELRKLLDYRTLTEKYEEVGRGMAAPNPMFDMYTAGTPKQFDSDEVEFVKLSAVKDPAPLNARGNPARVLKPSGASKRRLAMIHAFNMISLGIESMQMLRNPEQWTLQGNVKAEITRQMEDFGVKNQLTKHVWVSKAFTSQTIYIGATGEILESSTGAVADVATGIPSANLGQIAGASFGISGDIIDLPWDNPAALILTQLDKLNEAGEVSRIRPLKHVWLNRSPGKSWIRGNTEIKAFAAAENANLNTTLNGDTYELNGYTFHFFSGTYTNSSGTTSYFLPKTKAVITPDPNDGTWLAHGVGLQLVPKNYGILLTPEQAADAWDSRYGDFAYALQNVNPPELQAFMGFNWLFGFRDPSSVFAPDVDF